MSTIKFKRFTKVNFLKTIGRDLLGQFFNRFNPDLVQKGVVLPAATLDDNDYYEELSGLSRSPAGLPDDLIEVIHVIEGMANNEGQDRLERASGEHGPAFQFRENSTAAEMAVQAWLINPDLLVEKFNEMRLTRLAAFDYFGTRHPGETFTAPTALTLQLMAADMEAVFRARNRGQQSCHIEVHFMDDEYWFLIRHGDTYSRVPMVANGRMCAVIS